MTDTIDRDGAKLSQCHSTETNEKPFGGGYSDIADRVKKAALSLHITEIEDRFHVFEIPGPGGVPLKWRGGPFEYELAAELFQQELAQACAFGDEQLRKFQKEWQVPHHFDEWARIVAFIENGQPCIVPSDLRSLARYLCIYRPWQKPARSQSQSSRCAHDDELSF